MPLYEYQCLECEQIFEVFVQQVDPTVVQTRPTFGKTNVQRVLSSFAAQTGGGECCGGDGIG